MDGFELPVMSEALHAAVEHTDTLGELFEQVSECRSQWASIYSSLCICCMRMHKYAYVHASHVYVGMHVFEQEFDRTLSRMMLEWCLHKDL